MMLDNAICFYYLQVLQQVNTSEDDVIDKNEVKQAFKAARVIITFMLISELLC